MSHYKIHTNDDIIYVAITGEFTLPEIEDLLDEMHEAYFNGLEKKGEEQDDGSN